MQTHDRSDLERRMQFLTELEKLKTVHRQNMTVGSERHENSAEHSWHVALMALVLGGYANEPGLDVLKVITMLLNHHTTDGTGVRKYRIPAARVIEKKRFIADASPELWRYTEEIIRRSTEKGLYTDE